ncbi:hypothetical protein [Nocardia sp.]|uniref:hypothetical protein n=1 Tax=Nocardia sp. TaxID=1821 RepID=UPI00262043F1|nr:hypothetical protein [Nocardia sp.]
MAVFGALLVIVSMFAFVVGFIALFQGHINTLRINNKKSAAALLTMALLIFVAGVTILPHNESDTTSTAAEAQPTTNTATLSATSRTTSDSTTAIAPPTPSNVVRGILSQIAYWQQTFTPATSNECATEGENQLNSEDAWRLQGAVLACAQDPIAPISNAWNGEIVDADLYFSPHQDSAAALAAAAALLPPDIQQIGAFDGANSSTSPNPSGSCYTFVYHSDAAAAAVRQSQPTWSDPDKVSITLYTGNTTASDGSDSNYVPTDIHLAVVGIGGETRGADGAVHC